MPRKLPVPKQAIQSLETQTSSSLAIWQAKVRPWVRQDNRVSEQAITHINELLWELARTTTLLRHLVEDPPE